MKKKTEKNETALKKTNANKEKKTSKFLRFIKQKWLIKGTTTILLIAILIAIFILINWGVKKLNLTAIDCTTSKDYTLTDQSKDRIKDIDKEVKIYFSGYEEDNVSYTLSQQYHKANPKIKIEMVDANKDLEFAKKYGINADEPAIVVTCGDISRTLLSYDLYSYDSNYNEVDLTEQKVTSAILNVVSKDIPKVYFLEGFSKATFENGLYYLSQYLKDEVLTYDTVNTLKTGKVPDDCDTLVIMTPEKDFDNVTTKAIKDYINKGGNILWLNSAIIDNSIKYDNVNKILALYGVKPFDVGLLYETNQSNTILSYPGYFIPEVQSTDVTKDIYEGQGVAFIQGTKININTDKLEKLKVEKTDLILTSDTTYFTKDLSGKTDKKKDEKGSFTVGAQLVKTIKEAENEEENLTSTMIIYGDSEFMTDTALTYTQSGTVYAVQVFNNADLALNSIGSLTKNDVNITIRRDYSDSETDFTPTDGEVNIIIKIIFIVPVAIIALGIIVWIVRKNKK